jgi:predicted SnoaL-like aldol condensation-catalyzing enzyme
MCASPTNKKVNLKAVDIFHIANNQLVEHWDVVANLDSFIQLGLAKMKRDNICTKI